MERLRTKIIERLTQEGSNADEPTNIRLSDYSSDEGDTTSSSDEVGRDDDTPVPSGPPPSPVMLVKTKKTKPKSSPSKQKVLPKSPIMPRKTLPIVKATLKLSLSDKDSDSSSSSSDTETESKGKLKKKRRRRRRKKKKKKKNSDDSDYIMILQFQTLEELSDSEIQMRKPQKTISVFDLIPAESLKSTYYVKRPKTPQPKRVSEKKRQITTQLAEVQAKLYTLKNKLWFGTGNGDVPISWGTESFLLSSNKSTSLQKKKQTKVTSKKCAEKKTLAKDSKMKLEPKEKAPKNQNGLKRQAALEWCAHEPKLGIRKSKSLPDTASLSSSKKSLASGEEEKRADKKKMKKRRPKLSKKAKAIVNAKFLIKTTKD